MLTSTPLFINFFICLTSPRIAATCNAVSPRSFRLFNFLSAGVLRIMDCGDSGPGVPDVQLDCASKPQFTTKPDTYTPMFSSIITIIAFIIIICPIATAYSMGQIIKSVCICQCVHPWALSHSHFSIDFHQNWYRRKNPQK